MKNTALVAATLLAFNLAGCAATSGNGNGAAAAPAVAAGNVLYCMDGKLHTVDGGYRCTWAKTMKEACAATEPTVVSTASIATGPTRGGMCAHGDRIVHVTTR